MPDPAENLDIAGDVLAAYRAGNPDQPDTPSPPEMVRWLVREVNGQRANQEAVNELIGIPALVDLFELYGAYHPCPMCTGRGTIQIITAVWGTAEGVDSQMAELRCTACPSITDPRAIGQVLGWAAREMRQIDADREQHAVWLKNRKDEESPF